jgi:hypothetical protein
LVRLPETPKGKGLQEVIRAQAQASEYQIAEILGARRFAQLKQALAILVDQIDKDDT